MEIDLEELNFYYLEMVKASLIELEVEIPQGKLLLKRRQPENTNPAAFRRRRTDFLPNEKIEIPTFPQNLKTISSPINGVFYRSSSPAASAFVKEGDTISEGKTLCIVEAMKVMNEIKTDYACKIEKIMAENGKPVSKEQTLFYVLPLS